ncbi:MAG: hypothetical protein OHK006_03960 [Thermodesulfovibrionales bacterium]
MKCGACGQEHAGDRCPRCDGPDAGRQGIEVSYHDYKTSEMLEIRPAPVGRQQKSVPLPPDVPPHASKAPRQRASQPGARTLFLLLLLLLAACGLAYLVIRLIVR